MTSRLLISLSLLLAWQKVCAQLAPADDFFNGGAQFYISNNIPSALERVEAGRKLYPDDVKLKKLEELLKQQQQSQSQQSQQQQNQQDQSQQQQDKQQSRQQKQNSQDQQKQDQQKQNQADQNKNEQQQQQERQKSPAEKKDGQQNGQDQAVAAGQMTPEEAGQLLDAQKDNEQILQLKPQGKPEDQNRPIKDW